MGTRQQERIKEEEKKTLYVRGKKKKEEEENTKGSSKFRKTGEQEVESSRVKQGVMGRSLFLPPHIVHMDVRTEGRVTGEKATSFGQPPSLRFPLS